MAAFWNLEAAVQHGSLTKEPRRRWRAGSFRNLEAHGRPNTVLETDDGFFFPENATKQLNRR
jgi:hypothetical protein